MSIADLPAYLLALTPAQLVLWPALGGAGATVAVAVRDGRRRTALNECLHELRRPLQALVLLARREEGRDGPGEGPVEMASVALARLEREINGAGEEIVGPRETFAARGLLEAAHRRWRAQAAMRGKSLAIRWEADEALVEGDRIGLAAALDNLLANALEHGGERIELAASLAGGRICLAVVDSGSGAGRRARDRDTDLRGRETKRRRRFGGASPGRPGRRPERVTKSSLAQLGRPGRHTERVTKASLAQRGRPQRRPERVTKSSLAQFGERVSGRRARGHGLRLVRRTAARHGGAFALHKGQRGTSAVLELPLASSRWPERPARREPEADSRPEIVIRKGAS